MLKKNVLRIHQIEIYPIDSVIHLSNNRGQIDSKWGQMLLQMVTHFTKVFLTSFMRTENYHLQCGRVVRKTDQIINILWHWWNSVVFVCSFIWNLCDMFLISSVRSPSLGLLVLCNTERLKTYLISGEIVYNLLNMSNTAIEITIQLNNHDSSNKKTTRFVALSMPLQFFSMQFTA